MPKNHGGNKKFGVLAFCWVLCVILVQAAILRFQATPGQPARAPVLWPRDSALPRTSAGSTMIMFVHPSCDCTESSLREFKWLYSRTPEVSPVIVVSLDSGMGLDWVRLEGLKSLGNSSPAQVVFDHGLKETNRFGVKTSGDVLVYSSQDRLLFSGGITPSRGHEGTSRGQQLVLEALQQRTTSSTHTRVFGCPLSAAEDFCGAGPPEK